MQDPHAPLSPWTSSLPKIGIRPTIDGRLGGVRESLDDITMAQARSVADLLSREIRYPNGQPVECVIADACIGGVAEAAAAAEKFREAGVTVTLTVTRCGLSGGRARRPYAKRTARVRHLR